MAITLDILPTTWDAGDIRVDGDTAEQEFIITNSGDVPGALGTASVSGGSGTFTIAADTCSGTVLGPGESCAITVTFDPALDDPYTASLVVPAGFYQNALATDPVSYFRLDEAAGSFVDQIATGITGALSGGASRGVTGALSPADTNGAVDLNGTTGFVTFGDNYDFAGILPFSVGLWVMLDGTTTDPRFVSKENNVHNGWWLGWDNTAELIEFARYTAADGTSTATSAGTLTTDATYHFAVGTFSGSELTAYLDAVAGTAVASTQSLPGNGSNLTIGRSAYTGTNFHNGKEDEFLVWDRELTQAEVTMLDDAQLVDDVTASLAGNGIPNIDDTPAYRTVEPTWQQVGVDSPGLGHGHNDFVLYGLYNGNFALGPPDPSASIDVATSPAGSNFMPHWRFVQSSNTNISASQIRETASPSGSNTRFTFASGAAGDEAFMEQIVDMAGARQRWTGDAIRFFVLAGAGNTGTFTIFVRTQYLTVDGSIVGMPAEAESTTTLAPGTNTNGINIPGLASLVSPPATANRLRIRFGVRRGGAANSATGTIDFPDLRRDYARAYLLVAESSTPGTYPAGQITQLGGVMTLSPAGGVVAARSVNINALLTLAGGYGAIQFPASQTAQSGPNTLDDYEEGTWTPAVTFATPGDLSVAYTTQAGVYTKIGRFVELAFRVTTSSFTYTTASGALNVTGLPFTAAAGTLIGIGPIAMRGWTSAATEWLVIRVTVNAATADILVSNSASAVGVLSTTQVPTAGTVDIFGSLSYITAT